MHKFFQVFWVQHFNLWMKIVCVAGVRYFRVWPGERWLWRGFERNAGSEALLFWKTPRKRLGARSVNNNIRPKQLVNLKIKKLKHYLTFRGLAITVRISKFTLISTRKEYRNPINLGRLCLRSKRNLEIAKTWKDMSPPRIYLTLWEENTLLL